MIECGIDLSLAATGVFIRERESGRVLCLETIKPPSLKGMARIQWLVEAIADKVADHKAGRVVIETLNSALNMNTVRELLYLHGALGYHLRAVLEIEARWEGCSTVRKACGIAQGFPKGTPKAARSKMLKQNVIEWVRAQGITPADDNQADAVVLIYGSQQ